MPNFVFNKANARKKTCIETKRYNFKILSLYWKEKVDETLCWQGGEWALVFKEDLGKGVCLFSLQEGWKDMPRLLGDGILY